MNGASKTWPQFLRAFLVFVLALASFNLATPAQAAGFNDTITINFHYQRADQTFNDWKAWVWCGDGTGTWGTGVYQAAANATGSCTNGAYISLHNTAKVSEQVAQFTITGATNVSQIGVIMYKAAGSTNIYNNVTRDSQSGSNRFISLVDASTDVIVSDSTPSFVTSIYNPNPDPSPTATSTATATATPSPTESTLNGDFTVTIHYANPALVSTTNSFYTHVWLTDSAGASATGSIAEGSDPRADKDGMDSYGAVLKLNVTGATNVSKIGIIEYSIAKGDTTNTWIKDAASTKDRFIVLQGTNTEVWVRASATDTGFQYGPGSLTQNAGTGDPLSPNRPPVQTFKIHYNRSDGNYDGWKIYFGTQSKLMRPAGVKLPWIQANFYDLAAPTSITGPTGTETSTVGVDGFGPWVAFTLPYYAGHADWANMVVAKGDWSAKDGGKLLDDGNRYLATNANGTNEIWLLSGDTTSNGGNCAYSSSPFGAPTVTELTPTSAYRNEAVTVSGSNLFPVTLAAPAITSTATPLVTVGGASAVVTANNASSVTFLVPSEVSNGLNDVVVSTAGGDSSKLSLTVLHDKPAFTGVTPELIHRGDAVTVTGANFEQATLVKVGETSAVIDPASTDTELKFTVPMSIVAGTYTLTVTSKWGTSTKPDFVVVPDRPTITMFTPMSGKAGDTVTLTGTNLATTSKVEFAGQEAEVVTATDTTIQVKVPVTIPGTIKVTTDGGDVTSSGSFEFQAEAPSVTSIDPAAVNRGQLLTISGTNLLGATVTIGGVVVGADAITNNGSDSITLMVPIEVALGTDVKVIVTTSGGSDATASVTILPDPPIIESLSATQGGVGDSLSITGSGLADITKVTFNGDGQSDPVVVNLPAEGSSVTATTVTVIVPDGVTTGTITVTDSLGQSADSADIFAVFPKPEILLVQNTDGIDITFDNPAMRSDIIIVTGLNFGDAATVKVGDVDAEVALDVSSDTNVQFTVPDSAPFGTTTLAIKGPGGTSTFDFFVKPGQPSIDGLSANAGKVGDLLTISGLNLSTTTSVKFVGSGEMPVEADLSDPETVIEEFLVTVRVPQGTTTGTIILTTSVGESSSELLPDGLGLFTIADPPSITSLSLASAKAGAAVTVTGTNLAGAYVTVGGIDAVISDGADDVSLEFIVPDDAPYGSTTVAVTTVGGTAEHDFNVIAPAPKITKLSSVAATPGARITITGTFLSGASVKVRSVSAKLVGVPSSTSVTFTVPTVAAGSGAVVITTVGGTDSKSFTVLAPKPPAPKITSFTQSKVTKRGVGTVTVIGSNLTGASIKVGALKATVKSVTATKVVFVIPSSAKATTRASFVVTTAGGSVTSKAIVKITLR